MDPENKTRPVTLPKTASILLLLIAGATQGRPYEAFYEFFTPKTHLIPT